MKRIFLVAVGIQDSGNLGALARLCHNFELSGLCTVDRQCEIDDQAFKLATHGFRYLEALLEFQSMDELSSYFDYLVGLTARKAGARSYERTVESIVDVASFVRPLDVEKLGIVVGRESSGLTNEEIKFCNRLATIEISGKLPVFNISHAAALALYELFRSPISQLDPAISAMHGKTRAILISELASIIDKLSPDPWWRKHMLQIMRNVFGRSLVSQSEANATIGLFKKINFELTCENRQ